MRKVLALGAAAAAILVLTPGNASAAAPTSDPEPKITIVDRFERVAGNQATGELRDKVSKHIDDAMRRGQLVADAEVEVFTADVAGLKITAVAGKGSRLKSAAVVTQEGVNQVGFGAQFESAETSLAGPRPGGYSAGFGGNRVASNCRNIWLYNNHPIPDLDHVYDCYEKWRLSSSEYIYNRYSKYTLAQHSSSLIRREVQEFTIRFREAKGYSRITGGPYNYGPLPGGTACANGSFSYGVVTIPLVSCDQIQNLAGGSYYQSGTKYLGHETAQKYIDSYARYTSNGNTPVWSDYVWAVVSYCAWYFGFPCDNRQNAYDQGWTDGLWYR